MKQRGKTTSARDLRQRSTEAERVLWRRLRARRCAGVKFRRQHVIGDFETPFGGVLVLLVGDLTQLGPVQASHLTDAVMDVNLDHDLRSPPPSKKKKKRC